MRVVVTGGAGYVGSHTAVELLEAGHEVLVVDDLRTGSAAALDAIAEVAGRTPGFAHLSVLDGPGLDAAFAAFRPEAAVHFAGLKAVGDAVRQPLDYYECNFHGSVSLMQALARADCFRLVFSSSATVYGNLGIVPLREDHPTDPTNPYGRSKRMVEQAVEDWGVSDARVSAANLRYFNPVGAHPSGRMGEDPKGVPNNLMPFIARVAVGRLERLSIFGDDYDTADGTGLRDYIHVVDLARAHLAALDWLAGRTGVETINIGTGQGQTVLQMIRAFETVSGRTIPYDIGPRRPGDVARLVADASRARDLLNWQAAHDLETMCADAWRWQQKNPEGYAAPR